MGKGKRKASGDADGGAGDADHSEHGTNQPADPPRASIDVHPEGHVAICVGHELRVWDARTHELRVLIPKPAPGAAAPLLRGAVFDPSGRFLAAGGDDKVFAVWSVASWARGAAYRGPKKVSAFAFSGDGGHVFAADKFGDVLVGATAPPPAAAPGAPPAAPALLLGHYCSLLMAVATSRSGRLLATADRDARVRVTVLPADPSAGAHEIQALCFGHAGFASALAWLRRGGGGGGGGAELLASGGGDGTLRLWDPADGRLLCTLPVGGGGEGGGGGPGGGAPTEPPAVVALAASPDGATLVAALDGEDALLVAGVDWDARALRARGRAALPGLRAPTGLAFGADGRLWAAGGPPAEGSSAARVACATVAPPGAPAPLADATAEALPSGARAALEARDGVGEEDEGAGAERRSALAPYLRRRGPAADQVAQRIAARSEELASKSATAGRRGRRASKAKKQGVPAGGEGEEEVGGAGKDGAAAE